MKKKVIPILVLFVLLTGILMVNAEPIKKTCEILVNYFGVQVAGVTVNVDNIYYNGSTYVSLEKTANALGKKVIHDDINKTVNMAEIRTEDRDVIGKWKSIDKVDNISQFNPDKKNWNGDLYLKELEFKADGKINYINSITSSHSVWGDGVVFMGLFKDSEIGDKRVAQHYIVKSIDGVQYLFFEFKNGDYMRGTSNPIIFVFKREVTNKTNQLLSPPLSTQSIDSQEKYQYYKELTPVVSINNELFLFEYAPYIIYDNKNNQYIRFDTEPINCVLSIAYDDYSISKTDNPFVKGTILQKHPIQYNPRTDLWESKYISPKTIYKAINDSYREYTIYNSNRMKSYKVLPIEKGGEGVIMLKDTLEYYIPLKDLISALGDINLSVDADIENRVLIYHISKK